MEVLRRLSLSRRGSLKESTLEEFQHSQQIFINLQIGESHEEEEEEEVVEYEGLKDEQQPKKKKSLPPLEVSSPPTEKKSRRLSLSLKKKDKDKSKEPTPPESPPQSPNSPHSPKSKHTFTRAALSLIRKKSDKRKSVNSETFDTSPTPSENETVVETRKFPSLKEYKSSRSGSLPQLDDSKEFLPLKSEGNNQLGKTNFGSNISLHHLHSSFASSESLYSLKRSRSGDMLGSCTRLSLQQSTLSVRSVANLREGYDKKDETKGSFIFNPDVFDLESVLTFVDEVGSLPNLTLLPKNDDILMKPTAIYNFESMKKRQKQEGLIRSSSTPNLKSNSEYLRIGVLFMQAPLVNPSWCTYFCVLTQFRILIYETEECDTPPVYHLLITEINEIQVEEKKYLNQFICSIFSHGRMALKFSASIQEGKEWKNSIEEAKVDTLKMICRSAKLKNGKSKNNRKFENDYDIKGDKGVGGYSFVKEAFDKRTGKNVIAKFINKSLLTLGDDGIPSEVQVLTSLKHPNIVEIKDVFESEDYFIYTMEKFGEGMDLYEYLNEADLCESFARGIFKQVISAVHYLASQNLIHGDIKDENIIVNQHTNEVKLIDFGSCKKFKSEDDLFELFYGTRYMACPEIVKGQPYQPLRQEIWSLGVFLFVLLTGAVPFESSQDILDGSLPEEAYEVLSEPCLNLIFGMLNPDPNRYLSLEKILNHPWMKDF